MREPRNATTWGLAFSVVASFCLARPLQAATSLEDVSLTPDTPVALDGGAIFVQGGRVVGQSPGDSSALADLGVVPATAAVRGYHFDPAGVQLFSLDTPAELEGIIVLPRDVARFDGASYGIEFDGDGSGIPDGTSVDAISRLGSDLLLSFDTTVSLGGVTLDPGDLVRWDGATATLVFDASSWGVPNGLNLDAAHYLSANAHLLLSFDGSGKLGGVDFDDEDVLEFDSGSWELAIDSSAADGAWSAANLQALHVVTAAEDNCAGVLNPDQINSDTDPLGDACDPDDDNDGLLDGVETDTGVFVDPTDTGTDPLDPDTDDDGLLDGAEVLGGTDPTDDDSDDDGLLDGEEDALGTDPLNPDHDTDGICDGDGTGGGACSAGPDNCPFIWNDGQANSDFLPAGDACQCGDINGDFYVDFIDLTLAREHLMGKAITGDITRCNVVGDYAPSGDGSDCDVADITALSRYVGGKSVTLGNLCKPYFGGGP